MTFIVKPFFRHEKGNISEKMLLHLVKAKLDASRGLRKNYRISSNVMGALFSQLSLGIIPTYLTYFSPKTN